MSESLAGLMVGRWCKMRTTEPCAAKYPDEIEFREGGVYLSQCGEGQGFVLWGGGDYEIVSPNQIKLQIQTDEMVDYEISATRDQLLFGDPDGCRFAYQRLEPGHEPD